MAVDPPRYAYCKWQPARGKPPRVVIVPALEGCTLQPWSSAQSTLRTDALACKRQKDSPHAKRDIKDEAASI